MSFRHCINCGKEITASNREKFNPHMNEKYCEDCSESYWEELRKVIEK